LILVTGGTGFVGQVLIRHLVDAGYSVRILIRPSSQTPRLPKGVKVEVSVTGLNDARGLRAAMVGVKTIYHLAGVERQGAAADLLEVDVQGTRNLIHAAVDARVERIYFLSHLGSDRASGFPLLKAKAISEENIRQSGLNYIILRTGLIYGVNDGFTTALAQLLSGLPFLFLIPGDGNNLIQPLWVEDLATCLVWSLEDDRVMNKTYEIGGPEFLTLNSALKTIMRKLNLKRIIVSISPPVLRWVTILLEYFLPSSPISVYWLDYFSTNRTCALDTIPRVFNLMPSRFSQRLEYLQGRDWRRELWQKTFRKKR
jgi:NADH dehydrogenase